MNNPNKYDPVLVEQKKLAMEKAIQDGLARHDKLFCNENRIAIAKHMLANQDTTKSMDDIVESCINSIKGKLV